MADAKALWENSGMWKSLQALLQNFLAMLDRNKPWKLYRHVQAFITLLKALGMWSKILAVGAVVVGFLVAHIAALPLWGKILAGLGAALLLSLIYLALVVVWKLHFLKERSEEPDKSPLTGKPAAVGGPELVIDYEYEEHENPWPEPRRNNKPNAPLIIRNLAGETAYNVVLLPLEIKCAVLTFDPPLIPYVDKANPSRVLAVVPGSSPIPPNCLPT